MTAKRARSPGNPGTAAAANVTENVVVRIRRVLDIAGGILRLSPVRRRDRFSVLENAPREKVPLVKVYRGSGSFHEFREGIPGHSVICLTMQSPAPLLCTRIEERYGVRTASAGSERDLGYRRVQWTNQKRHSPMDFSWLIKKLRLVLIESVGTDP